MKKHLVLMALLVLSTFLGSAGLAEKAPVERVGNNPALFTQSVQQFSDKLFFAQNYHGENAMLSPLSVYLALGMTANGANGNTLSSMLDLLAPERGSLESLNRGNAHYVQGLADLADIELSIANSIWLNQKIPFDQGFLKKDREYYKATAKNLDFGAKSSLSTINGWVSDSTRGTIKSIIDSIDPSALMYLINAVYFKGDWLNPFTKGSTYDQGFSVEDEQVVVPFMHQSSSFPYAEALGGQVLLLPYSNERFAFVAILPNEETTLDTWLASQKQQGFTQRLFDAVDTLHYTRMDLSLPKFEASYSDSLVDELELLGMTDPFDAGEADFSLMVESRTKDLVIGEILHKTFIRVDEKGSEAAAVTAIMMKATSMAYREELLVLTFDRPFFYAIIDREAEISLFMGTMQNPEAK
ncbi:serpin family protein [Sphaerochaeta sp. PS]|uniref:serpin family protein n=1 Tax=Sphaerochaeta sp. PS TaxID=3076336 RepID=UPI0028A43910|nr:serpin family protein [Sphaerochaeta sp. PS]MDT4762760.1 serpin family protein [Sphaerochaeta sp. PS]